MYEAGICHQPNRNGKQESGCRSRQGDKDLAVSRAFTVFAGSHTPKAIQSDPRPTTIKALNQRMPQLMHQNERAQHEQEEEKIHGVSRFAAASGSGSSLWLNSGRRGPTLARCTASRVAGPATRGPGDKIYVPEGAAPESAPESAPPNQAHAAQSADLASASSTSP